MVLNPDQPSVIEDPNPPEVIENPFQPIIPQPTDPTIISGTGEVWYIDIEDGFYGIISADGEHYDPVNLPSNFMDDGLNVSFKVKIRTDIVSFHMWGTLVEILEIELLD